MSVTANGSVSPSAAPRADALRVEVWSDIACPWCYIGKRRFEAGVAHFARQPAAPPVVVQYRSFELAPDTAVEFEGSEIDFLVDHKQMPEGRVRQMLDQVGDVARSAGLDFDFDAVRHTNTRKAHQLLHSLTWLPRYAPPRIRTATDRHDVSTAMDPAGTTPPDPDEVSSVLSPLDWLAVTPGPTCIGDSCTTTVADAALTVSDGPQPAMPKR